jgi:uncharacterized membrane protein (DUF485 family)
LFPGKKEKSKNGNTEEHISQNVVPDSETVNVEGCQVGLGASGNVSDSLVHIDEGSNLQTEIPKDVGETCTKEAEEEVELDNLFFEDSSTWEEVAPEILKQQKIEKLSHDGYGHLLGNIDDIWKKVMRSYTIFMRRNHLLLLLSVIIILLLFIFIVLGLFCLAWLWTSRLELDMSCQIQLVSPLCFSKVAWAFQF